MGHRGNHASDLGPILLHDVADPLQAERTQRLTLILLAPDGRAHLTYLEPWHQPGTSARALRRAGGATSSTGMPRRLATDSGVSSERSASTVACTMLIAFEIGR